MEKIISISTSPYPAHEDGISQAVQRGLLFRNNPELNKLYQEGYRIRSYEAAGDYATASNSYTIQVHLVK